MKPLNNIDKPLESKDGKGLMADLEKIEFDVQQIGRASCRERV